MTWFQKDLKIIQSIKTIQLLTRLQLGLNELRDCKFRYNFLGTDFQCWNWIDRVHLFLCLLSYITLRQTLLRETNNINSSILNNSAEVLCKILLHRDSEFSDNKNSNILKVSINYTLNTNTFTGPLICQFIDLCICSYYIFWFGLQLWEYFFKSNENFPNSVSVGSLTSNWYKWND